MNIYDKLNDLTTAIKNSDEYLRYKKAAEAVDQNEQHKNMVKDFMQIQMEISAAKIFGQEPTDDQKQRFNNIYMAISGISDINEFLQAQMQFSRIMDDITKEISKAASVDVDFLDFLKNFKL